MAEPKNLLASFLEGKRNALLDEWYATPPAPLSYPVSEYTTPNELRQERISQALGWDTTRPWQELGNRAAVPMTLMASFLGRSPVGARIGSDHAWASQTPSAIMHPELGASLARRYPNAFRDRAGGQSSLRPIEGPANDLTRAHAHERAYDAAAGAQAARRDLMGWEAGTAWRDDLARLGFSFDDAALPALAQERAFFRSIPTYSQQRGTNAVDNFRAAHGSPPWYFDPATGRRLSMFDPRIGEGHPFWPARQRYENSSGGRDGSQ